MLERTGKFGISDLPASAQDMIPLGPLGFPYVEVNRLNCIVPILQVVIQGEWSVEVKVTHGGKVAAGLKFNPKHDWVSVELASEAEKTKTAKAKVTDEL